jgi:hypothetical protein
VRISRVRGGKRRQTRCREGDVGSASKQYQRCYISHGRSCDNCAALNVITSGLDETRLRGGPPYTKWSDSAKAPRQGRPVRRKCAIRGYDSGNELRLGDYQHARMTGAQLVAHLVDIIAIIGMPCGPAYFEAQHISTCRVLNQLPDSGKRTSFRCVVVVGDLRAMRRRCLRHGVNLLTTLANKRHRDSCLWIRLWLGPGGRPPGEWHNPCPATHRACARPRRS